MTNQDLRDFGAILKAYQYSVRSMKTKDFAPGEIIFIDGYPGLYQIMHDQDLNYLYLVNHDGEMFGKLSFVFEYAWIHHLKESPPIRLEITSFYILTQNP